MIILANTGKEVNLIDYLSLWIDLEIDYVYLMKLKLRKYIDK